MDPVGNYFKEIFVNVERFPGATEEEEGPPCLYCIIP